MPSINDIFAKLIEINWEDILMEKKYTICRLCSACCPVVVYLKNNKITLVERKSNSRIKEEYFCPKIKAAAQIIYSPHRIKNPMIKEKRNGKSFWREASWETALNIITNKLNLLKGKYGSESICWLRGQASDWGAVWHYTNRLMNVFGSPNTIGNGSVCHAARDANHTFTYGAMTNPDYRNSHCIIIWGRNDRDSKPSLYEEIIYAKEKGAKVIVIDPVKTKLASLADIWLQVKPGYDGMLAMSMIHIIISEKLYDLDFVRNWTIGFDKLKDIASYYNPEKIANTMWLCPEKIRESAHLYAKTKPACIGDGNGIDMHLNVSQTSRAISILRALTGNLDKKGGDLIPQPIPFKDIQLKDYSPKNIKPITFKYPLFNHYDKNLGIHTMGVVTDAILNEKPYPLKGLIIQGANPAVTMANSNRFLEALSKLELIVVIDLFMTQTAKLADIVLPTTTSFEQTRLNLGSMYSNRIVLQNKTIKWFENCWPDWKIIFELAKKLGYEKEFPWNNVEEAIDEQLKPSAITTEMLRQNPKGILFQKTRYKKYINHGFNTPTGKVELYSAKLKKYGHSPVPDFQEACKNQPSFYKKNIRFPLIGISGKRSNNYVHSQFRNIPFLIKREPRPFVDIHPKDARKRNISNGDRVIIESPNGKIKMKARISNIVHSGSVRIAWGWGEYNKDYNLNILTDDKQKDSITSTTSNRTFMCNIVNTNQKTQISNS